MWSYVDNKRWHIGLLSHFCLLIQTIVKRNKTPEPSWFYNVPHKPAHLDLTTIVAVINLRIR